jgi:hypothetical protein
MDECRDAALKAARATYEDLKRNRQVVKLDTQLELHDNLIDIRRRDGGTGKIRFVCAPAGTDPRKVVDQGG